MKKFKYPKIVRDCPFCGGIRTVKYRRDKYLKRKKTFDAEMGRMIEDKPYQKIIYTCKSCGIQF